MPLDFSTPHSRIELGTFILTAISFFFNFFALLTPNWHVAEDLDAHRDVQSGLWQYCQGGQSCWYIFSDDLVNYYERADICRFLLIYDCRKKLLRTPYFFGWHYAVLIMMIIAVVGTAIALAIGILGHFKEHWRKVANIVVVSLLALAVLIEGIGLAVFMINGEMLESRYLIGIKNTFEKHYGYSFYLAFFGCTILMFAMFAALFAASYPLFFNEDDHDLSSSVDPAKYVLEPNGRLVSQAEYNYNAARNAALGTTIPAQRQSPPQYSPGYQPSLVSGQTRTFLSY
ncbi:unnamed protein product [Bursaphelenchus xylophilus]|uniref:(pine wood nematode) hypothetical protein n=1 Tax=Bursaphelenchus xylophilus TaxID=6326 RepID=A0A1I7RKH2_BURXY|nr:unnamed protein product [Bursaphelenchus xylophilus]CAG9131326.1 unnamed protein product [Bursaphelenchus xylophilus]